VSEFKGKPGGRSLVQDAQDTFGVAKPTSALSAPGKRTLVEQLPLIPPPQNAGVAGDVPASSHGAPVQRATIASGTAGGDATRSEVVPKAAERVAGAGGPPPPRLTFRDLFGRQAAGGPKAAESESLVTSDGDAKPPLENRAPHGAQALATGGATEDHVHAAAQRGVAGAGSALPHGEAIQRAFGRHDVSRVKAHVGGEAATASRAIGAEAYATGNQVAFAAAPSLHTTAHEAAHVVQQRAGVHLKGGVGETGDQYERHANQVADAVVAGHSAEELLDRYAGAGGAGPGTTGAPVQRAPSGSPSPLPPTGALPPPAPAGPRPLPAGAAPAPAGAVPAPAGAPSPAPISAPPSEAVEAYHASTSAHDPHAPASRNASWDQVDTAGVDSHAQQGLDIEWVERLPQHLKDAIDESFADSVKDATVARAKVSDAGLKEIDREIDQQIQGLRTETVSRLAAIDPSISRKHGRDLDQVLARDQAFVTQRARLEADRKLRKEQRELEIGAAADGPMAAGSRADTVVAPPTAKITRLAGKALARTNFMSWAVDVLGSTEAAKRHFLSIREVSRQPGMFLTNAAKSRFEAARSDFEGAHPGYTFPSTDVAQHLRGFHQARQGDRNARPRARRCV